MVCEHYLFLSVSVRIVESAEITPTRVTHWKTAYSNKAVKVVDKDLSTYAATETGSGWFKLELGRTHLIHKVVIFYRFYRNWYGTKDWCLYSIPNFKECADVNSNVDVSVYQGDVKKRSCGRLQLTYGLKRSDQIYTLICNTEGDLVKLSKDTGKIAVHEVVVTEKGTYTIVIWKFPLCIADKNELFIQ